jgi:hypothetical protein
MNNKPASVINQAEHSSDLKYLEINNALDDAAYTLAISLNDVGIRKMIKEEVGKKFDGDYDVLLKNIADINTSNGNDFISTIANSYVNEQVKKSLKKETTVEAIKNQLNKSMSLIPTFQIAMPVRFDDWNAETYIPLVGYIEYNSINEDPLYINAYDADGNLHQLDALTKPEFPVIILGINERTDEDGNVTYKEPEETIDITPSFKSETTSDRVVLKRMNVLNLEEAWSRGAAEVYMGVLRSTGSTSRTTLYENNVSVDRDDEGVWKNRNWEMFQWSFSNEYVIIYWYEYDGWTISPPAPELIIYDGFTYAYIPGGADDDVMGWNAVFLEDLANSSYNNPVIYNTTDGDVRYSIYTH